MRNRKEQPARKDRSTWIAAGLILLFAVQALWHARAKSATFDEVGHLTASFLLHKTGTNDYDASHPPLLRRLFSIPLALADPSLPGLELPALPGPEASVTQQPIGRLYVYGAHFLYGNRLRAEILIFLPRMVNILLGCLLGFWIFRWSRKLYGPAAGILSLALFALCPSLIAHGSLVTTDLGGVVFAVGFLYSLSALFEKSTAGRKIASGAILGLALLSKYSNVFLAPLFLGFYAAICGFEKRSWGEAVKTAAAVFAAAWLVLCAGCGFENVWSAHLLSPGDWTQLGHAPLIQRLYEFLPLPDSFLKGIVSVAWHNKRGHSAYLLGDFSNQGWWYYFPVAFLVKTPTATLGLLAAGGFQLARSLAVLGKSCIRRDEALIAGAAALFLGMALSSGINIGLRHILIAYPLLYVLLGRTAALFLPGEEETRARRPQVWKKAAAGGVFFLLAAEVLWTAPHYLAFFNRASGGPSKGAEILSDSNIDWGQDLNGLAEFLKEEGNPELILSYFGTAVPQYYGINYQYLPAVWTYPDTEHVNSADPKKEFLAVSVTNLQGVYFADHRIYGWLKGKNPVKAIGHSIRVYDVTDDLLSHQKLLEIYRMTGRPAEAAREEDRVRRLLVSKVLGNQPR